MCLCVRILKQTGYLHGLLSFSPSFTSVCMCVRTPSVSFCGGLPSGHRATKRDSLSHVLARMLKHAHAHAHREGHIVWASDISSKTSGCNFVNPCGLAFDLEREQKFLFASACISASKNVRGQTMPACLCVFATNRKAVGSRPWQQRSGANPIRAYLYPGASGKISCQLTELVFAASVPRHEHNQVHVSSPSLKNVPTDLRVLVHAPVHCVSYTYTHTQMLPDAQGSEIARGQDHRSPLALHRRSSALLYRYREVRLLTELHSKRTSHLHPQSCTNARPSFLLRVHTPKRAGKYTCTMNKAVVCLPRECKFA